MLTKITHISIFVHDQTAALEFYQTLGFKIHTDAMFGEMRWLTLHLPDQPELEVALLKAETPAEQALVGKQAGDKPLLTFESTDCQADYTRLSTAGVTLWGARETQPWGTAVAFTDLYGNGLYLCQPS